MWPSMISRGADIDVVAGPAPRIHQADAALVFTEGQHEPCRPEPLVEQGVFLLYAREHRLRELRENAVGDRGCDQVRAVGIDAGRNGRFRIERSSVTLQGFGFDHQGWRTLNHRHARTVLPQVGRDIVGGIVGADDDASLAGIGRAVLMLARMMRNAPEAILAFECRPVWDPRHTGCQNQLCRIQRYDLAFAFDLDGPAL